MQDAFDEICDHLQRLTAAGTFLNAGVARIDGSAEDARVFGRITPDGPPLDDPALRLRMASISKAATARAFLSVVLAKGLSPEMPVWDVLDLDLPGITFGHLLSHTSGLTDAAGYIVDPPAMPSDILARPGAMSGQVGFFRYANLNYIFLGQALERIADDRFDRVLRAQVLDPAGIGGGFNWAGVADRRPLPVWQRHGETLTLQTDGPEADWAADLIWRDGAGVSLDRYGIGRETTLFSPHAGLRLNVSEAARLARFLASDDRVGRAQRRERWRFDGANGEDCDGLFTRFGAGLTLYDGHDRIPGRLIGHAGHALGFTGGIWVNRDTDVAWAYFLNGSPDLTEGQEEEAFYDRDELAIMARL